MWSLGGLLIKSIPWHPLAISGMRGGIAAIVIYAFSKNRKIIDFTSGLMVVNLGHNNKYI